MSALLKFKCPECGEILEGEEDALYESVICPHCDHSFLPALMPESKTRPAMPLPERQPEIQPSTPPGKGVFAGHKLRDKAERFEAAAFILGLIGIVCLVISCLSDGEFSFGIGSGLLAMGFWLYLTAQIIHIRANTEK